MTEHSLTTGEKLPMATQSSSETFQSLDLMVRVLLISRYLFALLGLAFFLWEGAEVFLMHEDLILAVIEVALISVLGPVLVWVSSSWALRLARDASRTHRQIQNEIAERRRTQDELQESEERFRRLVENAWDAFFLHDLGGRFVDVNQTACDSLGYTREELLALSVHDVDLNFAQDRIGDTWGQMIPKTPVTGEGVHKRRDGTTFPVEIRSGLLESGGRPLFLALARDVTERKRAEEALRKSEKEAQLLAYESGVMADIGRIIGSTLDIDQVYERFADQVRKLISFDRLTISAIDLDQGTCNDLYMSGHDVPERGIGVVVPLAGSATHEVMKRRSALLVQGETEQTLTEQYPGMAPGFRAGSRSFLSVPLLAKDEVVGVLHFHYAEPNAYSQADLELAERVATQIAGTIANAQLHAAIQHEADEREALAEIGRIISSTLDIDQVYERFADQVRKLIPFDRIVISRIDVERNAVAAAYISGVEVPGLVVGGVFALAGTAQEVMARTRSSVVDGAESPEAFSARFPTLAPTIAAGLRSLLAVPLISNDELIGTMTLRSTSPSAYSAAEVAMAERVANQIAGAIANAQLHGDLKRVEEALRESERRIKELAAATVRAHEEERQWSAIEVHDRISQPLAGLFHELQSLESITVADPQAREVSQRASVLLQEAIRECRNIMDALYPAGLDEFGLVALLDAELDLFERDTGCRAQLNNNLSVSVPKDVGVALYRIFHEALNNIRRHAASANNVIVSVAYGAQALSLYIQDDGPGFDVEAAMDGQRVSGLVSMSRRAEIIGGTCEIESAPGQGTAVKVHVPTDANNL